MGILRKLVYSRTLGRSLILAMIAPALAWLFLGGNDMATGSATVGAAGLIMFNAGSLYTQSVLILAVTFPISRGVLHSAGKKKRDIGPMLGMWLLGVILGWAAMFPFMLLIALPMLAIYGNAFPPNAIASASFAATVLGVLTMLILGQAKAAPAEAA
jgi:hypothetical protein